MTATARYDESIISDLYKDATGSRPRELFWNRWNEASEEERNTIWDGLCRDVEDSIEEDRAREREAVASYEARLVELQELGAPDRETAIAWLVDSLRGPDHLWQEPGEVCYELGLPFSMEKEFKPWYDRVMKPRWDEKFKEEG
jgi:hypothetical protein